MTLAIAGGLFASAGLSAPVLAELTTSCQTYDVPAEIDGGGSDVVPVLLEDGWTGDPSDGAERLYSPECHEELS